MSQSSTSIGRCWSARACRTNSGAKGVAGPGLPGAIESPGLDTGDRVRASRPSSRTTCVPDRPQLVPRSSEGRRPWQTRPTPRLDDSRERRVVARKLLLRLAKQSSAEAGNGRPPLVQLGRLIFALRDARDHARRSARVLRATRATALAIRYTGVIQASSLRSPRDGACSFDVGPQPVTPSRTRVVLGRANPRMRGVVSGRGSPMRSPRR